MAKLNEGDIVEGIFTIALSLYLAYGKVDKNALNKIRTQIDTKVFSKGRFKYTVASKLKRQKGKNPPDLFNVGFEMRLKPQSVQGAFDKEYEVLYKSFRDVGKIDMKRTATWNVKISSDQDLHCKATSKSKPVPS